MFAVWKYGAEADQVQSIRQAADPAAFTRLQACNRCHSKKIKCSGDKHGCARCVAGGHACDYSRSTARFRKSKSPESGIRPTSHPRSPPRRGDAAPASQSERRRSGRARPTSATAMPPNAALPDENMPVQTPCSMLATTMDSIDMVCAPMTQSGMFSMYAPHQQGPGSHGGTPASCYDEDWPYISDSSTSTISSISTEYLQLFQPARDAHEFYNAHRSVGVWLGP
ncbi:fungal zn(2)-Cys(6) binuclear cluster domain-containing protein [Purpureocillium lavendulum]|uniref:Fungal zn(2)-Cys(6) binuclear cluster domain-containing protein n=1 Tax=Purpureocillium lavendulum TaxID=1247861 RepID=A0AB34FZP0_9HYPO|nr:fungal zn(2)-Cys(6) binuclear cluster domain-containing protein [Purpureocillium lavendulum]